MISMNMTENKVRGYPLRALQLIFAIIVMGTDGHAIHEFRGHTVYEHFEFGNFYDYYGVPDAWGFLMFCAAWTVLSVIFHLIVAGISFMDRAMIIIGYIRVAIAVLSSLAGFIAVAVQISTDTCSAGKDSCGSLKAATLFGAFEWLLFMVTAALAFMVAFKGSRKARTSTTAV